MATVPVIKLNNGTTIPQFGFGVFQIPPDDTAKAVRTALEAGYRHIDTAQMYRNEDGVAEGIALSGIAREDVYITTKLNNDRHGYDAALKAFDESLNRLKTDYVDLFLIHWPRPRADQYIKTWKSFEKLNASGRARAIGVSNFQPVHLDRLANETATVPAVNQIELHPYLRQRELYEYHRAQAVVTEAWSPIAQGAVLHDPTITEIAEKHGKTPAQVVLRWHIQLGNVVFPKSSTSARIRENIDIFDFELGSEEMSSIDKLDRGERTGLDPDNFEG